MPISISRKITQEGSFVSPKRIDAMHKDATYIDVIEAIFCSYHKRRAIPYITNVYVIYSSSGYCKIGITKDLGRRLKSINRGALTPFDNQYIFVIPCSHEVAQKTEKKLHEKFAHKRISGEWFNLDPLDLSFIARLQQFVGDHWLIKVQEDNGSVPYPDIEEALA